MATSQNGYRANDRSLITSMTVPGTTLKLAVREGAPGWLLVHFAGWFNTHVEPVVQPRLDDWGYAPRNIRGSATELSNHASGTAIDLNATQHPMGRRGTFTTAQTAAIRHELRTVYDGAIRWGGDYHGRPDEMHFEINTSPAHCEAVKRRIQAAKEDDMPSPKDLWDYPILNRRTDGSKQGTIPAHQMLTNIEKDQDRLRQQVAHLTELVEHLANTKETQ